MRTALDTSVLLDILGADPAYGARSREAMRQAFAAGALVACEVVWAEPDAFAPLGEAGVGEGPAQFEPFGSRSFALKLAPTAHAATVSRTRPVTLTFDRNVATHDGEKSDGGFDAQGRALPAEMLPAAARS